jgi:hypothetical protein
MNARTTQATVTNDAVRGAAEAARMPESVTAARGPVLQRACACGGTQGGNGECEGCKKKRASLQRAAASGATPVSAPPVVHDVLRAPGHPLDGATRGFMEARFGRDFGGVRVHTDEQAAASARAVRALAYTVGSHVVFGTGQYQPAQPSGRRLLAHELTHVLQQGGGAATSIQRASIAASPSLAVGAEDDAAEREARRAAAAIDQDENVAVDENSTETVQRHVAIVGYDEAGPNADLTGKTDTELFNCMKDAKSDPDACTPNRALTWADFTGPVPSGRFAAFTVAPVTDVAMDPVKSSCLQRILGKSKDETRIFQAKLTSAKSWVRPRFKNPTNAALNGCGGIVTQCEAFFTSLKPGETGSIGLNGGPDPDCASSVTGDPNKKATSKAECKTVVGAECANAAQQESQRLLAHEQGHMDISCVIAKKATRAIEAGTPLQQVKDAVKAKLQPLDDLYDTESVHGCDATGQSTWTGLIKDDLKDTTIP